jgi:hypothetical protein
MSECFITLTGGLTMKYCALRQAEFVAATINWDNTYNGGRLQKSRFHHDALEVLGGCYYNPDNPKVIADENWETFDQHMNGYLLGFASQVPGDTVDDAVGYALDRLFDHIHPADRHE